MVEATREIKHRGKTVNGDWVYGHLVICPDQNTHLIFTGDYQQISNLCNVEGCNNIQWGQHVVIPETVGQFIGKYDCIGAEIYEHDNVKFQIANSTDENMLEGTVEYFEPSAQYMVHQYCFKEIYSTNLRVIGNIHDIKEVSK